MNKIDWSGVHAALDAYWAGEPVRYAMLFALDDPEAAFQEYEKATADAVNAVRLAFYEATKDVNSKDKVMRHLEVTDAMRASRWKRKLSEIQE